MVHDRTAAGTHASARVVARNLLPTTFSISSVSESITSLNSSSTSASEAGLSAPIVSRRDPKHAENVTSPSTSTLSTASSPVASCTKTASRRAQRFIQYSQPLATIKSERSFSPTSYNHHSHLRPRDTSLTDATVGTTHNAIGMADCAIKQKTYKGTGSPPAVQEQEVLITSSRQLKDKDDITGPAKHTATVKPSRMVVKRRATEPVNNRSTTRQTSAPSIIRPPCQSGGQSGLSSSPRIGSISPSIDGLNRSPRRLEKWQLRLQRSRSGTSSGTDEERSGREATSSRRVYRNLRSRQLMESPPPPIQDAATSRRRQRDSLTLNYEKALSRRTLKHPASFDEKLASPPPLSLSADAQSSSSPRSLARKLVLMNDDNGIDEHSLVKPRPVRIRYETPARGMGGKREIAFASLGKLIARLTDAHEYDTEFRDVFLLTYRSFCSPYDFIKKLLKRYKAVLSLSSPVSAETLENTQRLLDQIALDEEENEQRASIVTSLSTAKSDINTGMEANVSMMRLLSVLKYWIKESTFIEQDLVCDRKSQKKLVALLKEIQCTSPIPSICRHAENLLLTVAQLLSAQKPHGHPAHNLQGSARVVVPKGSLKVPPPPTLVTSSSASALPDRPNLRLGAEVGPYIQNLKAVPRTHHQSDRGDAPSQLHIETMTKLALPRSTSDPKREPSMVKLRTKNTNGDIFQLRSRPTPTGAEDHAKIAAPHASIAAAPALIHRTQRHGAKPHSGATVAPKMMRGITTGSAEALSLASAQAGGLDAVIQDTLQRARVTASSRRSARISYDNIEPLSGLSAQELADQLTLVEADQYFSKLNPRELTNKAWTRETKYREAPHVMALIELFDGTAEWVSSEILHPQLQAVERAKIITLFIEAADQCYQMNNFNTLFEISTGLLAPCIRQLNTTWSLINASALEKYQCLQQVCSPEDNYRSYRQAFALAEGHPRLACWFILVKDLFTYEESMKTMEDGLVNWQKFRKIFRVINDTLDRQNFAFIRSNLGGATGGGTGANTGNVSRKGRGILRHDRKIQLHIRHRIDTIRKDSSVLYQLARNANTHESILFVNSLSEAGFL
ncbi:hypothetical protein CCR75_006402 [Bremia lactucae]|uniref:Ras guanine nucleotide exchange factor n=1 Tax=Bremia lactucae TaxID=4779 RepID=A0A976IKD9_BRELC|nr:hypothetical protein CCR75_006402 [Bremia lactucae]